MRDSPTWIRHNLDAHRGRRFVQLRLIGGYAAHGIYWAILEQLYKYGNKYPLANAKQREALASELHITVDQLDEFIDQCEECEKLLEIVDGCLQSDRVGEELDRQRNLANKRKKAGRAGGLAKAKQMLSSEKAKPATVRNGTVRNNTIQNNKRALSSADFSFPPKLDNDQCRKLLDDFIQHRSEIKKPSTKTSIEKLLKRYAEKPAEFIKNAEHSIENGWQGIFPPSEPRAFGNSKPDVKPRPNITSFKADTSDYVPPNPEISKRNKELLADLNKKVKGAA